MPDDKTEADAIWRQYYGNPDGLALRLTEICLTKLGVVYQVFAILDNYSDYDVGCRFQKKLSNATLQKLLETNEGIYFCKQLYDLLNNNWNAFSIGSCYTSPGDLLLFKVLVDNAKVKPNQTAQPRELTQAEIDFYKKKGGKQKFNLDIVWELPESGAGFVAYKRNDVTSEGLDQIGTKETVERVIQIAAAWNSIHSDRILQIGDISRPGGIDTSQHKTHQDGKIFDMRPLRNDNATGNLTYKSTVYSRDLTKEFIKFVRGKVAGTTVLFNDKAIHTDDAELAPYVNPSDASHDNHLHVMFPGGL